MPKIHKVGRKKFASKRETLSGLLPHTTNCIVAKKKIEDSITSFILIPEEPLTEEQWKKLVKTFNVDTKEEVVCNWAIEELDWKEIKELDLAEEEGYKFWDCTMGWREPTGECPYIFMSKEIPSVKQWRSLRKIFNAQTESEEHCVWKIMER